MTPLFFGTKKRLLFGVHSARAGSKPSARAALFCNAWGQEYLQSHLTMRRLATQLNQAGLDTFRFDYYGTGDSAGETEEGDLAGWKKDIEMAIAELQDMSGAKRVSLVGLRLGATLAAAVAATQKRNVERLVLWDPVVDGAEYVQELKQQEHAQCEERFRASRVVAESGEMPEVLGFPMWAEFEESLEALSFAPLLESLPERSLIVLTHPLASHSALRQALRGLEGGPLVESIDAEVLPWIERRNAQLPVNVLARIVEWLK